MAERREPDNASMTSGNTPMGTNSPVSSNTPTSGSATSPTGGIGRAIAAPVRAVTRMFAPAAGQVVPQTGQARGGSAVVDCGFYVLGARQLGTRTYAEALSAARERDGGFVWLGLHEPGPDDIEEIASVFDLDTFAVEDAIKGGQRAKIEQYGEMTFLVVRTARYLEHGELTETSEIVETGDLMFFVGRDFVITVRHGEVGPLSPVRAELEADPALLRIGPWAVVYAILDRIVDSYLDVAGRVEDDIDAVESHVFAREVHGRIARIYQLKRELVEFKRAVLPLQRPLAAIVEGRLGAMPAEVMHNFRDVHDHLIRTVEQVVTYDDLLNSILQARLAQVTVEQNNDLRKIASWAAIAAMQTAIAGIYGMNFEFMPETGWRYGYPLIMLVMLGAAIALYRLFRRSGWL
jgi:magnesium transporter